MFKQIATSLLSGPSGTLRLDTYAAIDAVKAWLQSDQVGDGLSVNAILKLVAKHTTLPSSTGSMARTLTQAQPGDKGNASTENPKASDATTSAGGGSVPFLHITIPAEEIPIAVGGVTNLVLALSRSDSMAGVLAARAWTDALTQANTKSRSDAWRRGIVDGINQRADMSLLTTEFGPRLQVIHILKTVAATLFGRGSEQARQSDAFWSTKVV
ncbi:hypothetical protein BKA62DRAFT_696783 [Auriculariales sp. MPI-PUGE-AT-0066]|nr:hypothetical protein BKA62DRAFT_696783 [Auriculariales sp. MPI-PUGE-AT-0066]